MLFGFLKQKRQEKADDQQHWRERWQSLVPEENRSVPVTVDGQTRIAYIQINQFVVMLQDGLLMKAHFFDVCEFFQKAGYHVVWLMRCVQDVEGGYLKLVKMEDGGARTAVCQCEHLLEHAEAADDRLRDVDRQRRDKQRQRHTEEGAHS